MSFIETIEIKNFKSIRHQKIEGCRKINVFIGYPNVGKSNILEAISNFSISNDSDLYSDFVRIGKSPTLFFDGNVDEAAEVILNDYYRVKLTYQKYGLSGSFQLDRFKTGFSEIDKEIQKADVISISDARGKISVKGSFDVNESNFKIGNFAGAGNLRIFEEITTDFALALKYKDIPVLKYEFKKDIQYDSKDAWKLKYPYGQNIFEIISTKPELNDEVINLFKEYNLNFVYDSGSQEYKILKIIDSKIFTVPFFMSADTLRRLIFHKAAIISNKNSVLLFEEPEAHMFPPYISKFTGDIVYDENNNQFFITTQSPFVLNDLIDGVEQNDLAIYIVSYKKETGETIIHKMSDADKDAAYQFGYDFFMNINKFIPQETHG